MCVKRKRIIDIISYQIINLPALPSATPTTITWKLEIGERKRKRLNKYLFIVCISSVFAHLSKYSLILNHLTKRAERPPKYLLLIILCHEHFAIVHPFEWRVYHSKGRATLILLTTWIVPCVVASPFLYGAKAFLNHLQSDYGVIHRLTCFDEFSDDFRNGYFIFLFVFIYVLPLGFITGTCFNIAKELLKGTSLHRQGNLRRQEINKRKIAKMVIVVVIAFTISWTPYFLVTLISQFHTSNFLEKGQFFFTMLCINLFAFLNSCINPFIYALMSKRFRNGFRNIVRSLYCRQQLPINSGTSSQRANGTLPHGRAVGGGASTTDPSASGSGQFTILRLDSLRTFTDFSRRTLSAVWRSGSSRFHSLSLKRSRSSKNKCNRPNSINGSAVFCKHHPDSKEDDQVQIQQLLPVLTIESPLFIQQIEEVLVKPLKDTSGLPRCSIIAPWNSNPNLTDTQNKVKQSLLRKCSSEAIITALDETIV
uniref:G-protein coupled receptors family 1 profile domain-containing protein n=1 Tax=Strigamia maritima TaxID=126957 RepID=T1IPV2_STRMM